MTVVRPNASIRPPASTPPPMSPEEELAARDAAEQTLAAMAFALLSDAPELLQIILPAEVKTEMKSRVEEATDAVVILDDQGHIASFDDAAQRVFQRSEAEVVGADASLIFGASDGGAPLRLTETRSGKALHFAASLVGLGAHAEFPVEVHTSTTRIAGRQHFVLRVRDLVELHRVNEPTRQAEARYRALVEQIPAVTFMAALDEGRSEMYVSPQIESLLGFSQKEWLDDPILWFKQLHPDDQTLWNQEFARGIASGGPFRAECRVFTRDRRLVWIHGEARLVRDDNGKPLMLQGIAFDITESKRALEVMRDAQDAKVKHERLAAIGQLAASIGHDIRNPIAAARNASYFISKRIGKSELASDARVAQSLGIMDKELAACNRIVADLLDYARERAPAREKCALSALIDDAISVIPRPETVSVVNELPDDLPAPMLDPHQFRQVIVNLVQNAVEAIPAGRAGRVWLGASIVGSEASPDAILLTVNDNGSGIPEENRKKIFEPLFTSKVKGTGLGLSIVVNTVERHGGTLTLTTERDRGTTFTLRIPLGPLGGG